MALTLNRELWSADFAKALTEKQDFWTGAKNDSTEVLSYGVINIPQSNTVATGGTYVKGTTTLPLTPSAADATILSYSPVTYYFAPIYLDNIDAAEYSFNVMEASLADQLNFMQERIAEKIAYEWTVTSSKNVVRTTGTARANKFANASAKAVTYADIVALDKALNIQKAPKIGRRLLISESMYSDLLSINQIVGVNVFQPTYDAIVDGKVGRILGFDVYLTTLMASFTSAVAKKAIGASDANTDLEAAIAFHPSMVRYGIGSVELGFSPGALYMSPTDVVNGWGRVGATPNYLTVSNLTNGIVTLIEAV